MVFKRGSIVYFRFDIRGLQKGEIYPISFRWMKKDDGEVSAFVDSNNANIESNEKNNVAKITLAF
jgi:subtilase family serine protease